MMETSARPRRMGATVTTIGLLGLLLSAIGLYGVIAYVVRSRSRELGIRLALGAEPASVRRLVIAQGFRIVGIGLIAGLAITFALAAVLRSLISGLRAPDPLLSAAICAALTATVSARCPRAGRRRSIRRARCGRRRSLRRA